MANSDNITFHPEHLPFFKDGEHVDSAGVNFAEFAIQVAADEVFLMRPNSQIVYVNQSACNILGYTQNELIGKFVWEWDPLFPESAWPNFWNHFVKEKHLHFETQHRAKNGHVFPVDIHAYYYVNDGDEYILAFVNDLTATKQLERENIELLQKQKQQAESKIIHSKNELEAAQSLAKVGSWKLVHNTNKLTWSAETYRIFDVDPNEFEASYDNFLARVHPEDRDKLNQAFLACVEHHQAYEIEHRLVMDDESLKFVIEKGQTFYDDNDVPIISIGTVQDITQRKKLEIESLEAKQQYQIMFDHSPDAYLIMELDGGRITDCNRAAELMLKGERHQILGMTPDQLSPPTQPDGQNSQQAAAENIKNTMRDGRNHFDWVHQRLDGTDFWAEVTVSVITIKQRQAFLVAWRDISERKQLEKDFIDAKELAEQAASQSFYQASHDPLTGLLNRLSLNERLEQILSEANRSDQSVALLFIDMDRFKHINDSVGHQAGDSVIQQMADRLRSVVKRNSDVIARIGGDEFIVVLNNINEITTVANIAERILQEVRQPYTYQQHILHSSGSIGIALYPQDCSNVTDLIKHADIAMYDVKEKGRNKFKFYSEIINEDVKDDLKLENDLYLAIEDNQLSLHYQPQLKAHTHELIGLEALLRWHHPEKGLIPPGRFIDIAEKSGQIRQLGSWVINQACSDLARWRKNGYTDFKVAINISVIQLRSETFIEELKSSFETYNLPAEMIEIEITESIAMDDPENTIETLNRIKALGCHIAIDDFGTGYSSLAYLKHLPVNTLKLDRSFVADIETDENDRAICKATLSLAHSLGLQVIAEGVETEFQKDFLSELNCDFFQGYLFSRPMPFEQVNINR